MNARIAQLEALLARVSARKNAPRDAAGPTGVAAGTPLGQAASPAARPAPLAAAASLLEPHALPEPEEPRAAVEPLPLDSPSIIPPSGSPDSLDVPELDAPLIDRVPDSVDVTEVELDDEVPESGPVATPKSEALPPDSEQPITPPPESVEELVAPAARPHVSEPAFVARSKPNLAPTMEQLGQTVDLDEGDSKSTLELDEPGLDDTTSDIVITPALRGQPVTSAPSQAQSSPSAGAEASPQVARRAPLEATVVAITSQADATSPRSFLELIDAALRLR